MSYTFNAEPKVVKSKLKYRKHDSTKQTPLDLEREYVKEQEDFFKDQNMNR